MTPREMGFIKAAARGLRLAQKHLQEDPATWMEKAMNTMADEAAGAISNHDIAYFAAMLVAWEDAGRPDYLR